MGRGASAAGALIPTVLVSPLRTALQDHPKASLRHYESHPLTKEFVEAGDGTVPLRRAGEFLALVGRAMNQVIAAAPKGRVLKRYKAISTQRTRTGWLTLIRDVQTGHERTIDSHNLVLATGATSQQNACGVSWWPGSTLSSDSAETVAIRRRSQYFRFPSDLCPPRRARPASTRSNHWRFHQRSRGCKCLAASYARVTFGPGGVTLLHRRELRIFYPSVDAALADGYKEFGIDDICPVSGRVFRLGGFRLDSRELIMSARGIGGRPPEPRLQLHRLGLDDAASLTLLDNADLVIAALGYRPRALPVFNVGGRPVPLLAETSPRAQLVDGHCRVLDAGGKPLPSVICDWPGCGLCSPRKAWGEPSFRGRRMASGCGKATLAD